MSGYDSSSFKKTYQVSQSQPPMREFNVGAPSTDDYQHDNGSTSNPIPADQRSGTSRPSLSPAEIERQVQEARKEKATGTQRITDSSKKRIEILANIGRLSKDVKLGDISFSLRTLKSKENEEATRAIFANSVTQLEASLEARKQQLARSIYKIDGQDIDFVIGSVSFDDRLAFIGELEDIVVEALWENYVALKEEVRAKYGINTEVQAKEVIDDLKK